ncbi:DUF2264 domain-containing protein [Bifidobacterium sp. ESL0690]|uniref:DUF2264 domain-containing protein n=1 Tax=Bifidobacterium sp. ESL0690 TaxID=2983214 RepID=UPI0023F6F295|nr:DUF2264 domain-containing protein [Bifidobacterium sp. ESL0690]WEV46553.1 DUF2264 domain-containing protein [Bifidobacterium sp. ESL0690]
METKPFNENVATNPLRTKADCEQALVDILAPAMRLVESGRRYGRFRMSDSGAVYSQDRTSIEGFCRLLWGLGPLFANRGNISRFPRWWQLSCGGILHGTTPGDPDFWGNPLDDYDQLFVEMGAITAFLFETRQDFWDHLSDTQQSNILTWLDQINAHELPKTNWLWFRQMVNTWFVHTGHPEYDALVQADFDITTSHYLAHGWSYDGYKNQIDNYIPFAYQFFTLMTVGLAEQDYRACNDADDTSPRRNAKSVEENTCFPAETADCATSSFSISSKTAVLSDDEDSNEEASDAINTGNTDEPHSAETQRYKLLKQRATAFVPSYANWFAADGACLPFGRSLDYRFAQAAFWGAAAFASIDLPTGWSLGDMKHLLLGNLRWWFRQNIFQSDGLIPIGYAYPNMNMAEGYNGPASAYWALKTFIFLCIPDSDIFWTTRESDDFKFEPLKLQPEPRMLVAHSRTGLEVQAFTAGQHAPEHNHTDAKYEKYVYSTTFGFSTPKATTVLKQLACDNTLAVSESEYHWRMAFGYADYAVHGDYVYSRWEPWSDVTIRNFIVPLMPWHIRVHVIDSARALHLAEGGFAMPDFGQELAGPNINAVGKVAKAAAQHAADGSFASGWDTGNDDMENLFSATRALNIIVESETLPNANIQAENPNQKQESGNIRSEIPKTMANEIISRPTATFSTPQRSLFYRTEVGLTGLIGAQGFALELSTPEPNTNLLYPKTRIPMQMRTIDHGHYVFISAYLGDRELESVGDDGSIAMPTATLAGNELCIGYRGETRVVDLTELANQRT